MMRWITVLSLNACIAARILGVSEEGTSTSSHLFVQVPPRTNAPGALQQDPFPPLLQIVESGSVARLKEFLRRGGSLTERTVEGQTALMIAGFEGHTAVCRYLLSKGSSVDVKDRRGYTALLYAAIGKGDDATCNLLLGHGASVEVKTETGRNLVSVAAQRNATLVKLFARRGVAINATDSRGTTALMIAADAGVPDAAHYLIAHGADIHACDNDGETALHHACRGRRNNGCGNGIADLLLTKGGNTERRNADGMTPLLLAARDRNLPALRALLHHHVDPNATDKTGRSALHYVASNYVGDIGNGEHPLIVVADLLLRAGASPELRDEDGNTATDIAEANSSTRLARFIREAKMSRRKP